MTWGIVTKILLSLVFFSAIGTVLCPKSNSQNPTSNPTPDVKGKNAFEVRCAICHGLDGLGGEHAPDIVRQAAVKSLSDQALLDLIHNGIPEAGMPGFPELGKDDNQDLVAYLRFLQGKSGSNSMAGDPGRGRDLFFGKAGCGTCHSRGKSMSEDLTDFARDHGIDEIREAIVTPSGPRRETATAIAKDGRQFSGTIRNEDNASLQLQDKDGRFYLLMKSTLVSVQRKSGQPMPSDYGQRLNNTELNDLVGYVVHEARSSDIQSAPMEKDPEQNAQH